MNAFEGNVSILIGLDPMKFAEYFKNSVNSVTALTKQFIHRRGDRRQKKTLTTCETQQQQFWGLTHPPSLATVTGKALEEIMKIC